MYHRAWCQDELQQDVPACFKAGQASRGPLSFDKEEVRSRPADQNIVSKLGHKKTAAPNVAYDCGW
eukprot:1383369-Pyramimonas_sp.AAC.1